MEWNRGKIIPPLLNPWIHLIKCSSHFFKRGPQRYSKALCLNRTQEEQGKQWKKTMTQLVMLSNYYYYYLQKKVLSCAVNTDPACPVWSALSFGSGMPYRTVHGFPCATELIWNPFITWSVQRQVRPWQLVIQHIGNVVCGSDRTTEE